MPSTTPSQFIAYGLDKRPGEPGTKLLELPNCQMSYSAKPEYDATGRTLVGYNVTIRGQCQVIGTNTPVATGSPSAYGTNAVVNHVAYVDAIISNLNYPRLQFVWQVGGDVDRTGTATSAATYLFNIKAASPTSTQTPQDNHYLDRRFGPKPKVLNIQRITGGCATRIEFEIDTFILPIYGDNISNPPPDLDEFTWKFDYSLDRNFQTTRSISGTYRFRSATAVSIAASILPQGAFFPPLPVGFYRDKSAYSLSPNGLVLTWSIVDKQVWRTLPRPFTSGNATMNLHLTGAVVEKRMSFEFEAPTDVNKAVILDFIISLIQFRFPLAFTATAGEYLHDLSFEDYQFENKVSGSCSSRLSAALPATYTPGNVSSGGFTDFVRSIFGDISLLSNTHTGLPSGQWTGSDGNTELRPMVGTAGLIPVTPDIFTMDAAYTPPTQADIVNSGGTNPTRNPTSTYSGVTNVPMGQTQSQTSTAQIYYPYTSYIETINWLVKRNFVQIPILASTPTDGTTSFTGDVVQQVAPPTVKVIQVGYAVRIGRPIDWPEPAFVGFTDGDETKYVEQQKYTPETPQLMADGKTLLYKGGWSYVVMLPDVRNLYTDMQDARPNEAVVKLPLNPQLGPYFSTIYADGTSTSLASYATVMEPGSNPYDGSTQPEVSRSGTYTPDYRYD